MSSSVTTGTDAGVNFFELGDILPPFSSKIEIVLFGESVAPSLSYPSFA